MQHIAELIQFRELLWTWTTREVKIRALWEFKGLTLSMPLSGGANGGGFYLLSLPLPLFRFVNSLRSCLAKIRYKQSLIGGVWALFQPLPLMLVFTVIFGYNVKTPSDGTSYLVFSYCALLPWILFAASIGVVVRLQASEVSLLQQGKHLSLGSCLYESMTSE